MPARETPMVKAALRETWMQPAQPKAGGIEFLATFAENWPQPRRGYWTTGWHLTQPMICLLPSPALASYLPGHDGLGHRDRELKRRDLRRPSRGLVSY